MALWLLLLATWLCNLGVTITSTSVSETVLAHAPQGRSGTVASMQSASCMTGAALGPTVYVLLLNFFFHREWLADAATRGLSVPRATQAVDAVRSQLAVSPRARPCTTRTCSGRRRASTSVWISATGCG